MSEKLSWHRGNSGKSTKDHVTIQVVGDEGHWVLNGPQRPKGGPEIAADIERAKKIVAAFNTPASAMLDFLEPHYEFYDGTREWVIQAHGPMTLREAIKSAMDAEPQVAMKIYPSEDPT